jgi:microcystin-dependent protein
MSDQFVAEIRIFPFNFPPTGWAWCDGQLLPISQNTALFSLLGTTYGGNGKSNFGLPNFQGGCAPMHPGQGPGLSLRDLGETGGSATVTLLQTEIPGHSHALTASSGDSNDQSPANEFPATGIGGLQMYAAASSPPAMINPQAIGIAGGSLPHNNMQPFLALYFNIALQGVFPARG